ncbi:MAG: 16S rRNA (cytosine(1402)-N(4))-methyltransferase RsmH [Pseudomonadota bacterium]
MNEDIFYHTPVMVEEVLEWLKVGDGKIFLDGTLGGGGHAFQILKRASVDARLIGIDKDANAIDHANERLKEFSGRFDLKQIPFSRAMSLKDEPGILGFDGILLDLGISSAQVDLPHRGFSFGKKGPLDMRMGPFGDSLIEKLSDADVVSLSDVIEKYGEERRAKKIASLIIKAHDEGRLTDTLSLAEVVAGAFAHKGGKINVATKTFQALRIWVNDEIEELKKFLSFAPTLLLPQGRLVIISYHSLEDRLVKRSFKGWTEDERFFLPHKKVVMPKLEEIRRNKRARSAKLRILEREA